MSRRRYDLDWLRVFAFGVLIFYHVGLFYVTWDWYLKSRYSSVSHGTCYGADKSGRLALLFFISGVAVRFAIDKTTLSEVPAGALHAACCSPGVRHGGDLCAANLCRTSLSWVRSSRASSQFYRDYLGYGEFTIVAPPWNHLWYVAYILVYTLITAACLPLLRIATSALGEPFFRWLARGRAWRLLVVPAIPFAVYTMTLEPYFPTTLMLWGDWANIARTLTFFLFGFMAAKNEDFWNAIDGVLPASIILSLVLGGLLLTAFLNEFAVTADPRLFNAFLLLKVFYGWSIIVTLLGLARRFANRPSSALTYLTAAIFPYYILHQTITCACQLLVHHERSPGRDRGDDDCRDDNHRLCRGL